MMPSLNKSTTSPGASVIRASLNTDRFDQPTATPLDRSHSASPFARNTRGGLCPAFVYVNVRVFSTAFRHSSKALHASDAGPQPFFAFTMTRLVER
jgi:hypothetical protein